MSDRLLGLFAKQPVAGMVKTRLAAETSAEWAARVAEAFLLDSLDRLATLDVPRVIAHAPAEAAPYFTPCAAGRFQLEPQAAGDLGQRMAAFFTAHLAHAERVVLVGSDAPSLPTGHIEQAFAELAHADIVIGPASDGGYYLIGCARQLPPIFTGVRWSSSYVLADTIARLEDSGLFLALLPPWYDVDTL
ncbi:MAG: TIGR04282 family arsenosugar biosynthesis glycosyltransferase, partial [Gemmataceae bacterium]